MSPESAQSRNTRVDTPRTWDALPILRNCDISLHKGSRVSLRCKCADAMNIMVLLMITSTVDAESFTPQIRTERFVGIIGTFMQFRSIFVTQIVRMPI